MVILLSFGAAFLASILLTPIVIRLAYMYKWTDDSRIRSHPATRHTGVIPRAGGLALYGAIVVTSIFFIPITKVTIGVFLGGFIVTLIGVLYDRYDLSPALRLLSNLFAGGVAILFGLGVPYITQPLTGGIIHLDSYVLTISFFGAHSFWILANLFSLLWISSMMNFVNWSSGVDGQLSGFVAVSSIFLGLLALRFSAYDLPSASIATLCFIVAGAFAGFGLWHFYPQKIMPGYGGSTLAGYFLAVLSILSYGKLGVLVMVLAIPLVDALYAIIRRISKGKSPLRGDDGHFHHRLLAIGWGRRRITVFYGVISLLYGISALYMQGWEKVYAIIVATVLMALFILITNQIKENRESQ